MNTWEIAAFPETAFPNRKQGKIAGYTLKTIRKKELLRTQQLFCIPSVSISFDGPDHPAEFRLSFSISLSFSASTASYLFTSVSVSSVRDTIFDLRIVTLFESSG